MEGSGSGVDFPLSKPEGRRANASTGAPVAGFDWAWRRGGQVEGRSIHCGASKSAGSVSFGSG